MSAFLKREGCKTVGFEKSMWIVTIKGHKILLGARIDDFVIACAHRPVLDAFRAAFWTHLRAPTKAPWRITLAVKFFET